jgi:hypothetical protein
MNNAEVPERMGRVVEENKECFGQKEIGTMLSHIVSYLCKLEDNSC